MRRPRSRPPARRTSPGSRPARTSRPGSAYGVPTTGTSAHSFTLLHDTEADAFRAQVASLGRGTTLLVDTYDIAEAVRPGGRGRRARRSAPSGSTPATSACSRSRCATQLDALGATGTQIVVTSDLDEFAIAALAAAPVDGYGVGTELVTGSGHPTCGFVYKLVAREDDGGSMVSVAKKSLDKISVGAASTPCADATARGVAEAEVVGIGSPPVDDGDDRPLLVDAGARRRGRRPRAAGRRPRAGTSTPARSCRSTASRCPAASRSSRPSTSAHHPVVEVRSRSSAASGR